MINHDSSPDVEIQNLYSQHLANINGTLNRKVPTGRLGSSLEADVIVIAIAWELRELYLIFVAVENVEIHHVWPTLFQCHWYCQSCVSALPPASCLKADIVFIKIARELMGLWLFLAIIENLEIHHLSPTLD
jgi:hypothetical protein